MLSIFDGKKAIIYTATAFFLYLYLFMFVYIVALGSSDIYLFISFHRLAKSQSHHFLNFFSKKDDFSVWFKWSVAASLLSLLHSFIRKKIYPKKAIFFVVHFRLLYRVFASPFLSHWQLSNGTQHKNPLYALDCDATVKCALFNCMQFNRCYTFIHLLDKNVEKKT